MESRELAFFGKIAAGVTHELKNVLAVINESSGLMGDLMAMNKNAPFPQRERFLRSIAKIEEQVRRGVEITGRFNRFSHSMDHATAKVDLNEIVTLTVALAQRFARLKNVELMQAERSSPVMIVTDPFRLQMALTKAIEGCISAMNCRGIVSLAVGGSPDCPEVGIRCETVPEGSIDLKNRVFSSRAWKEVEELAAMLGAEIDWTRGEGAGFEIRLEQAAAPALAE